jgi:hypothetical protein
MAKQRRPLADFTADREAGTEVSTPVLPPPPVTLGPEIPQNPPKLDAKPVVQQAPPVPQIAGSARTVGATGAEGLPLWKPNRKFRSEGNLSRFQRTVVILEELAHFAEDSRLHGEVGVELLLTNGEIHTTRKRLGGTEK